MTTPEAQKAASALTVEPTRTTARRITDEYAGRTEAAEYLRVSKKTLERWQAAGTGPVVTKIGRTVYYRWETLRAWVVSCECLPLHNPV